MAGSGGLAIAGVRRKFNLTDRFQLEGRAASVDASMVTHTRSLWMLTSVITEDAASFHACFLLGKFRSSFALYLEVCVHARRVHMQIHMSFKTYGTRKRSTTGFCVTLHSACVCSAPRHRAYSVPAPHWSHLEECRRGDTRGLEGK